MPLLMPDTLFQTFRPICDRVREGHQELLHPAAFTAYFWIKETDTEAFIKITLPLGQVIAAAGEYLDTIVHQVRTFLGHWGNTTFLKYSVIVDRNGTPVYIAVCELGVLGFYADGTPDMDIMQLPGEETMTLEQRLVIDRWVRYFCDAENNRYPIYLCDHPTRQEKEVMVYWIFMGTKMTGHNYCFLQPDGKRVNAMSRLQSNAYHLLKQEAEIVHRLR